MKKAAKKRKLIKGILALILAAGAAGAVGWMMLRPVIPEFLRASRNTEGVSDEVLRIDQEGMQIAVFKPELSDPLLMQAAEEKIQLLLDQIEPEADTLVKIDYTLFRSENGWLSLLFDASSNAGSDTYYESLLWDENTQQPIAVEGLFDLSLRRRISRGIRNPLKKDEAMGDIAYSRAFYEATSSDIAEHFDTFSLNEDTLSFWISSGQFGPHEAFSVSFDLTEVVNHTVLPLNKEAKEEPLISIPERVIDPSRPMVALTFDDGPLEKNMRILVDVLERYDQAATFYLVGNRIPGHEDAIREMISCGNEAASHSYAHPKLTTLKSDALEYQLTETSRLIDELTGSLYQVKTFRPPYGAFNATVKEASPYPFILWNIDTLDWKTKDPDTTIDNILSQVEDGDIILMHEIYSESVQAAQSVLPQLIDRGFQLVTVSEMMEIKGIQLENGVVYRSANHSDK